MGLSDIEIVEGDFYDFIRGGYERVKQTVYVRRVGSGKVWRVEDPPFLAVRLTVDKTLTAWKRKRHVNSTVNSTHCARFVYE